MVSRIATLHSKAFEATKAGWGAARNVEPGQNSTFAQILILSRINCGAACAQHPHRVRLDKPEKRKPEGHSQFTIPVANRQPVDRSLPSGH